MSRRTGANSPHSETCTTAGQVYDLPQSKRASRFSLLADQTAYTCPQVETL